MLVLDKDSVQAMFSPPRIDGRFEGALAEKAAELGRRRPLLLLAFAPKSAGTYFREAAIRAIDGALVRIVHAEGGRDVQPYLPTLIAYYLGGVTDKPLVTHVHMHASTGTRNLLDAFGIRPLIMVRSIPDMLASFWDMIEKNPATPMGLSFLIPEDFTLMSRARKADLFVDMMGPWYAHYFATWVRYIEDLPGQTGVLSYEDFCDDPAAVLEKALLHAGFSRTRDECRTALESVWQDRSKLRFNRGRAGRGGSYFSAEQLARLARMLSHYSELDSWRERLLKTAPAEPLRTAV